MLYDHEDGMKDGVNAMETSFDVDICAVERTGFNRLTPSQHLVIGL
jgi:hypothetical protein